MDYVLNHIVDYMLDYMIMAHMITTLDSFTTN